jgi:hypothetical protein
MRTFLRTLGATAALSALLLGAGASSALAASDQGDPAHTYRYVFHDEWCFNDGVDVDCSIADGVLSWTTTPQGRTVARIHYNLDVTTYDENGVKIGESSLSTFDRTIDVENGQTSTFTVQRQSASGEGYDCSFGYLLRVVDFELQMEKYTGPGCN